MREYIKKNLEPLLIGFISAMLVIYFFNSINDIIIKIALINKG